jgi:hypothetical protein
MDKLDRYRRIIRQVLSEYASWTNPRRQVTTETPFDRDGDHYQIVDVGWDGSRRVYGTIIHIDIIGEKVWVQYDGTDRPVAEALFAAGIPKEDIVLAFHPERRREHTGYAVR